MMATRLTSSILSPMNRLLSEGILAGLDDGQLLHRFLADRDELAFAALVDRHGPMIWGVCRRYLVDPHEMEDAFQATFLVLVQRAQSLRAEGTLGPWLHGVARRVAVRAKSQRWRREARGEHLVSPESAEENAPLERAELLAAIDEEVARLPGKCRAVAVLCDLEDLNYAEAARRLQCPVGTVKSRLARARKRIRGRLIKRGLAPATVALAAPLAEASASRTVPGAVTRSTFSLSRAVASGVPNSAIPQRVAALAAGVGQGLEISRRVAGAGLLAALVLVGGCWLGGIVLGRPGQASSSSPRSRLVQQDRVEPPWAVAPRELATCAGHGSIRVYVLDQNGKRQVKQPEADDTPREWQEGWRELRWVVVTGILDHRELRKRYAEALAIDLAAAHPHYRRVELQRQERRADQRWSEWEIIQTSRKQQLLRNIPEAELELAPAAVRLDALVDLIPFSRKAAWRGVNVDRLIAVQRIRQQDRANAHCPRGFELTDAPEIMIRSIDFTVEAGKIYRYRARIVVANPEENPEIPPREFAGPWSDPAPEVLVPSE